VQSPPTSSAAPQATPLPTSQEALTEASPKIAAKSHTLGSAPLHTNTILDMPARPFNKTMMDMGAAEQDRFEFAAQDSLLGAPNGISAPGNVSGKAVDFAENVTQADRARTPFPDANEGEDNFDRNRVSGSRPGRVPGPVSAQKSLITPRHFIRPLNIPELTTPDERKYTQAATVAAVVIYGLSVICLFGIVLVPLIMFISHVLDGVRLGRMRGNGIKVTPEQFPEVFEAVHNLSASLGMQTAPETYVMNKSGVLNACAKNYHQRDYVIIYTDVLELAYSFGESELAFVISHELAHIQCGHLKRKWLDFPAKLVPFLGQALSRSREYTCDRIAKELVPEGASVGLVALSVGTKLFRRINMKALYAQQDSVDDFWSSFSEAISSKPNLNSRIRALAPGEDRSKNSISNAASSKKR
jgi:Zn-dependent protease with chaperone function